MTVYRNSEFNNQTVHLDYNAYYSCTFKDCTIVFSGGSIGALLHCSFIDSKFIFDGPAKNAADMLGDFIREGQGGASVAFELMSIPATFPASLKADPESSASEDDPATAGAGKPQT